MKYALLSHFFSNRCENKYYNLDTKRNLIKSSSEQKKYIDHNLKVVTDNQFLLDLFIVDYKDFMKRIEKYKRKNPEKYLNLDTNKENKSPKKNTKINEYYKVFSYEQGFIDLFTSYLLKKHTTESPNTIISPTSTSSSSITLTNTPSLKKQKTPITKCFKNEVWERSFGNNSIGSCFACSKELIRNSTWHCGHILSEANGGPMDSRNMKPLCEKCNKSMNKQYMYLWMLVNGKNCKKIEKMPSYSIFLNIIKMKKQAINALARLEASNKISKQLQVKYTNRLNSPNVELIEMLGIFDLIKEYFLN